MAHTRPPPRARPPPSSACRGKLLSMPNSIAESTTRCCRRKGPGRERVTGYSLGETLWEQRNLSCNKQLVIGGGGNRTLKDTRVIGLHALLSPYRRSTGDTSGHYGTPEDTSGQGIQANSAPEYAPFCGKAPVPEGAFALTLSVTRAPHRLALRKPIVTAIEGRVGQPPCAVESAGRAYHHDDRDKYTAGFGDQSCPCVANAGR